MFKAPKPAERINRTAFAPEAIKAMPVLFTVRNNWRNRNVSVYQHPEQQDRVLTIGESFDGLLTVIADETKADYAHEFNLFAIGKTRFIYN